MLEVQTARAAMFDALKALANRFETTSDPTEQDAITDSMDDIKAELDQLALDDLLKSANAVTDASVAVTAAVKAAQKGPFNSYLTELERILGQLDSSLGAMHDTKALPDAPETAAPLPAPQAKPLIAPLVKAGVPKPSKETDFAKLKDEYAALFAKCVVRSGHEGDVKFFLKMLDSGRDTYRVVGPPLNIPWHVVGLLHGMEASFNFHSHLHNGDPLTARTTHVPQDRPVAGSPPFSWVASAQDALRFDGLDTVTDWSIPHTLYRLERFNGMGYRKLGVPSPYLWSFCNLYSKGKFVADGEFDPEIVSKQIGAGLVLKTLVEKGIVPE